MNKLDKLIPLLERMADRDLDKSDVDKHNEDTLLILANEVRNLKFALGTLVSWTAQSAGAPLARSDYEKIMKLLENGQP